MIHYKQMEKSDRDPNQAIRAEDECRQLLTQFPNSKFVPEPQQLLRNIQEVLADGEFRVGAFYLKRGDNPAAVNRLVIWWSSIRFTARPTRRCGTWANAIRTMGPRFRQQEGEAYARIVRDYPLSDLC